MTAKEFIKKQGYKDSPYFNMQHTSSLCEDYAKQEVDKDRGKLVDEIESFGCATIYAESVKKHIVTLINKDLK